MAFASGREEKFGNYRVEPPASFLGHADHPKRGNVKVRTYPEDVTFNVGVNDPGARNLDNVVCQIDRFLRIVDYGSSLVTQLTTTLH